MKFDNRLLVELGLGSMDVDAKNEFLQHMYETIELRVGMVLAKEMSDQQLDEFEGYIDVKDEEGALVWLEDNFPHYKDVVDQQVELLLQEIRDNVDVILAAS